MRKYTIPTSMAVEYSLGDHLGSTSITTDSNGAKISEIKYKPWGEIRSSWTSGAVTTPAYKLAKYLYTGQFSYLDDPTTAGVTEGFGLMFYQARWYDPSIGRFAQADTVLPDLVQGWDRYAYVNNNPIAYTDPSGHRLCGDGEDINCDGTTNTTTPPIDLGTQADPSQPDTLDLPGQPDDLVAIYLRYRYMWYQPHDSWWWKRYGRGGFTFWEFMSIFFGYEQNVYPTAQDFATTMGNRAPAICSAINCNPHSVEGALRFVATLESARRRMTCLATGACNFEEAFGEPPIPSGQGSLSILEAIYMSAKILPGRHEMYNLGNESMQPNIYRKMISLGFVYSVYGLRGQNRMVILTFCQQLMVDYAVFNGGAKVINGRTYRDFCGE